MQTKRLVIGTLLIAGIVLVDFIQYQLNFHQLQISLKKGFLKKIPQKSNDIFMKMGV